jgi:hypothetical protein
MEWIYLAEDRDQFRALVNEVIFGFRKMLGKYCVAVRLAASEEGLCSVELVSCIHFIFWVLLIMIHKMFMT